MARFAMATFGAPEGGPYCGPTPPSYQSLCGQTRLLAVLSVVRAPVHTIDVDKPPDEFSANRHVVIVSCGRGFGVHANKVESDRQPVGRRAGGVWPTRLGAGAGRASPLPARRRLSDTAYPQLLLRPGQRHAAQPRHPGRRRLGRAADGLVLRHRAAGRRRLHLAAAVGAAEPLGDVQRHEHAAARRLRLLCPRPSLCLSALAGTDLHRLSPVHRRARGQSLGQPHGAADLRGLCAAREARRRQIFCRLRGGHEAARPLGLHQHGRSRRRARRQCRHGAGQPQIRRPDQGRARCTGIGLHRAGHPVVELLRRHGRDPDHRRLQGPAVRSVHGPGKHRRQSADGPSLRHLHRRRQGRCDLGPDHAHRRLHADRQRRRVPHAVRHLHRLQQAGGARLRSRRRTIVPDRRDLRLQGASACPVPPSWPMLSTAPTRSIRRPAPSSRSGGSTISTCSCAPRKCRWRCRIG